MHGVFRVSSNIRHGTALVITTPQISVHSENRPSILFFQDNTYVPSFQTFEKPTKTLREIELMSAHKTRENNSILRIGRKRQWYFFNLGIVSPKK
jgi:hypothetical protein